MFSLNGIELIPANAPKLSSLFQEGEAGPHTSFISNESCEKCHTANAGTHIMGKIIPDIPHDIINSCNACHLMANE